MEDDVQLTIEGFETSSEFGSFAKDLVYKLHLEAPGDSITKATFRRFRHRVEGVVHIYSTEGEFIATASGSDPYETAYRIVDDIYRQLEKWHERRTLEPRESFWKRSLRLIPGFR